MLEEITLCEEVFHTASGVAFADFITDRHRETWPIRSKIFRAWVRRCYYRATGAAPSRSAIGSALDLLEARAQFDAPERAVNIRVAEHAGRLYLDLADDHWRAVAIAAEAEIVDGSPRSQLRTRRLSTQPFEASAQKGLKRRSPAPASPRVRLSISEKGQLGGPPRAWALTHPRLLWRQLNWNISQPRYWLDIRTIDQLLVAPKFLLALPEPHNSRFALLYELGDDLGKSLVLGRKKERLR
jgi:hypothetical protein